jgi:hypothetical protein
MATRQTSTPGRLGASVQQVVVAPPLFVAGALLAG